MFFSSPSGPAAAKYAAYDSWLTVGLTQGESNSAVSVIGEDFDKWDDNNGLTTSNGAVFWMNPNHGPSKTDADGYEGKLKAGGEIVVAQLTVKAGGSYEAQVNCQGKTNHGNNWRADGIRFHLGRTHGTSCSNVQLAAVTGCVKSCQICKGQQTTLQNVVTDSSGMPCVAPSGELATQLIVQAIQSCSSTSDGSCTAGHFLSSGRCVKCRHGTVKAGKGPGPCVPCPPGHSVDGGHLGPHILCRPCSGLNNYINPEGECSVCPTGKMPSGDRTQCFAIPPPPPPPPPAHVSPPAPPPSPPSGHLSASVVCSNAATAAMVSCCAPGMSIRRADAYTSSLLFTCMSSAATNLLQMCQNPTCKQALTQVDTACKAQQVNFVTQQIYSQLRRYVSCSSSNNAQCSDFASMTLYSQRVVTACCKAPQSCPGGFPVSCSAECALELVPMQRDCSSFLNQSPLTKTTLSTINSVVETCPAPCDDYGDFSKGLEGLTNFCCDDPGEKCTGGVPTSCDMECATVLIPFSKVCGKFLSQAMNTGIKKVVDQAISTCHRDGH